MSALEGVVEGLKAVSTSLALPAVRPDRTRRDWDRASVDALLATLQGRVLQHFDGALAELSDDEHRKFKDIVARVTGSVAAVAGAAGRADEARALLGRAAELAASQVTRMRFQAAGGQLEWHVSLALAEWLGRAGDAKAARKTLDNIAKNAPDGLIRSEAQAAIQAPPEELEPVGSAPSLFTLNGFGTGLYGRGDKQPDGSYVTTLCLCVLFIPVFPLTSYRVIDSENGGYYFLGKMKLRRGWVVFRSLLLAGVVLGVAGFAIQEELRSPKRLAHNAIAHAAETEKAGNPTAAAQELDAVLDEYRGQGANDELTPALEAWLRIKLATIPQPVTPGQVDALVRLSRRVESFGGEGWTRQAAIPLVARLRSGATELGTATPERTEGSLTLLAAAEKVAPTKDQNALAAQVRALHLGVARGLASWPMWSLEHLVLAFPEPEAITGADEVLRVLGDSPQVLEENQASIDSWLKQTKDAALAAQVKTRLLAGQALLAHAPRAELLASRDVKRLTEAVKQDPLDQAVAVALALELRDRGDPTGALRLLTALGAPGVLTSEALSLRAGLAFETGDRKEGRTLLEASVDRNLGNLKAAREAFHLTLNGAEQRLIAAARRNEMPASLRKELETAGEEKGRELFSTWLRGELEKDTTVLASRERYGRLARVAGASVSLGSLELQEASAATGEARERLLSRAEHHFVAVQSEGEGTVTFDLGYGQVLHRLGRAKEGDALLEGVLTNGKGEDKLHAALAYRQLGLVQRARQAYEQIWKSDAQPVKDLAAGALAAMADRIEDDELWLSRIEERTPMVRTNLAQVRARRLQREGKLAEADREFTVVFDFHAQLAKNDSAAANNAGIVLLERYDCTGDPAHLDRALEFLRTSRRLSPESALSVGHLADGLEMRAAVRLLEPVVHVKALKLDRGDALALLGSLLDGDQGPALRAAMASDPLVRELKEVSLNQEALAPGNTDSYVRLDRWAAFERDTAALRALAERSRRASGAFDFSEELERLAQLKSGAQNEQFRASWHAQRDRLNLVVSDAHVPTRAAALYARCGVEAQLSRLDTDLTAARAALADCQAAQAAWPALRIDLSWMHAVIAMLEAQEANPVLKAKWKESAWGDQAMLLSSMLEDAALAPLVTQRPAFVDAVRALADSPQESLGLSDWLIATAGHEDAHVKRVVSSMSEERALLMQELRTRLTEPGATTAARQALYARAVGKPATP